MGSKIDNHLAEVDAAAAVANDDEHTTTIVEAFKQYPSAVFWAVGMSFTIGKVPNR
jgi:SP family general alpha glucoside:H+ symporter-like MFS transporter